MPADRPAAAPLSLPALPGPLSLTPVRARHLDLRRLGGPPGSADPATVAAVEADGAHHHARADPPSLVVHELTTGLHRVRGVVGLLGISPPAAEAADRHGAALLPHEGAISDRVTRLADRMSDLGIDPAPILLLHQTTQAGQPAFAEVIDDLVRTAPDMDGLDADGGRHRWWNVTDPGGLRTVERSVACAQLLIADGHHRYAAHLDLAGRRPPRGDGRALVMVVDAESDAPVLAPIHRVLTSTDLPTVVRCLAGAGHHVESDGGTEAPAGATDTEDPDLVLVEDAERTVRVRVEVRDGLAVVEHVHLALAAGAGPTSWSTHHEAADARAAVRAAPGRVGLILPRPASDEVWAAARAGRALPAKATSFTPKPPLGLVFRSWRDGSPGHG